LLFQYKPQAGVEAIEGSLKQHGVPVLGPDGNTIYPRIDVLAAYQNFDSDMDGLADGSDNCPQVYNPGQVNSDADTLGDACDNCPLATNEDQANVDGDGSGDVCDCDSSRGTVYHGAPEVCDGVNNDCSHPAWPSLVVETDEDGDGLAECGGDCDDADPLRRGGVAESCDGIDNDCNGSVPLNENDLDMDGARVCQGDCNDGSAAQRPGLPEACDGFDNDCDGGVPADEADADADGYRICANDCDDARTDVNPAAPEICDGSDNDCAGGVPPDEADADADGVRVCQEDCHDGDAAVYPGAPEVCDGRNNDCGHPQWPAPVTETDDDGDLVPECAGDCDDAEPRKKPGLPDLCDELDNDCNGSVDPGYAYLVEKTPLGEILDPNGAAGDQVGASVTALPDLTGDGVPDIAVGAVGYPPGGAMNGSVLLVSGATRLPFFTLLDPASTSGAQLGTSVAAPCDATGDGVFEVAAGAPYQEVQPGTSGQGRVRLLDPNNGNVVWTFQEPSVPNTANLGIALAAAGDVNADGFGDLAIGTPGYCDGATCGGAVLLVEGDSGIKFRNLFGSPNQSGQRLGTSVAVLGDLTGDGRSEIAAGAPRRDVSGRADAGAVFVFNGATGAALLTLTDPNGAASDELGTSLAAVSDLDGDGRMDLAAGAPLRDTPAGADAGSVLVFSTGTGAVLRRLVDPNGAAGDRLGSSVARAGDVDLDLKDDLLAGSPRRATAAGAEAGQALLFSGRTGALMARFDHPAAAASDRFGGAVAGLPPLDADGVPEIAVGAPLDDTPAGADGGTVQIFTPHTIGDCDGDGIRNTLDPCTDTDGDAYGSTAFGPPACPADCDDDRGYVKPGALQLCDGFNNDCDDPSWPEVPPAECFVVPNVRAAVASGQVRLSWDVPAGGADLYRIYRAERSGHLAGRNGGLCFATTPAGPYLFTDEIPAGTFAYYLVVGVRGVVEGSRGTDWIGEAAHEREHSDVCP
jgi:hypothetical protein